jgi:hypothetical protein
MSDGNGRSGFWGTVVGAARYPFAALAVKEELARNDRLLLENVNTRFEEAAKAVIPDNDQFENALVATADRELDETSGEALRDNARIASLKSTHMRGYLGSLGRFVVGVGPTFTAQVENEETQANAAAWWALFGKLNKWNDLEDEIPHRTWRDGETFTRFFVQDGEGPPEDWEPDANLVSRLPGFSMEDVQPPDVPDGMTFLRLIPPEQIRDPDNKVSHGILTAKRDVVTPLAYIWAPKDKIEEVIPAREIQHIKINVDQDVKRGRSQLEVLLKRNTQYEQWLGYRIVLNLVRSAVVLIKKITGATATQVAAIKDKWASTESTTTQTNSSKMLKPGSTVHATGGIEYDMLSPNLQATDAQHDGRSILLSEAAGTGLPEYMFTGDSSNANFASTMVSESPAVREFQRWQDFYEPYFRDIYRRVMVNGAEANQIKGLTAKEAMAMPITVTWPPLLSRDELKHTQANQIRHSGGILSKEGWAEDEGIDFKIEAERTARERQDAVEFTAPGGDE